MTAEDDPGIGDDDLLHRRVLDRDHMIAFDDNLQRWTPLNAAIRFDPDGMRFRPHLGGDHDPASAAGATRRELGAFADLDARLASWA